MADSEEKTPNGGSHLFAPFRAIGLITNHVPFCLQTKGSDSFLTTVVGRSFHTYNCAKLNLVFVGEPQDDNISAITSDGKFIIAVVRNNISFFSRGKKVFELKGHESDIKLMLPFSNLLIAVDEGNEVKVWDCNVREEYLSLKFDKDHFEVSALVHPATYLNKILFGSYQGSLQLWNIKTNKLLYTFEGWSAGVLTLEQAPALDVIAIGLVSGHIYLHNIRYDESVIKFHQEFGPVTCITFRTDGISFMATGSSAGHITIWDLENSKVSSVMRMAHRDTIHSLKFLLKQPLLLSAGEDNSILMWIFDSPDGTARILRSRAGHSGPVTRLKFYGKEGHIMLSSSLDRSLRYTSIINDHQSCELSQGSLASKAKARGISMDRLRLPPITDFDFESTRERDWDNIVTCHKGTGTSKSWSIRNKCLGKHSLKAVTNKVKGQSAVSVKVSSSGHFVLLGYSTGQIEVFNLQSGVHRGSIIDSSLKNESDLNTGTDASGFIIADKAHSGAVRGIEIDSADMTVVSGSIDKTLKFWWFQKRVLSQTLKLECPVRMLKLHKDSCLLAVALDDFSLQLYDIETRKLVRVFKGHSSVINSIDLSSDGRWILSSAMDSTVRVWNVPSARLIDYMAFDSPVTCLALSPTGEFLATSHLDDSAVYLWSNKTLYGTFFPTPLPTNASPVNIDVPSSHVEGQVEIVPFEDDSGGQSENESVEIAEYNSPDQLGEELVTLALLPESRWRSLVHLDVIKSRNKPKQPPQKPKQAPFFLTTVPGLEPTFVAEGDDKENQSDTKVLAIQKFESSSKFLTMLKQFTETKDSEPLIQSLKLMPPSLIDIEMRSLESEFTGIFYLESFMAFLITHLKSGRDFEVVQGLIGLFIKQHGLSLSKEPSLVALVVELQNLLDSSWLRCEEMINQSLCLLGCFKSVTI